MRQSPFLQSVHQEMLRRRYAKRTIETYLHWIKRFILFHQKRHPETMGDAEVEAFLDHLVLKREVAPDTLPPITQQLDCGIRGSVRAG